MEHNIQTDAFIIAILILIVVRQLRGRVISWQRLLLPVIVFLVLISMGIAQYITQSTMTASGIALMAVCILIGTGLGAASGVTTEVARKGKDVVATATWVSAGFWIAGISGRLLFGLATEYGGEPTIEAVSRSWNIDVSMWSAALLSMAFMSIAVRTLLIAYKWWQLQSQKA